MISVLNLCKKYYSQTIFDDVSFNISSRERVGVVGRNGHGKTTLFKIITGQEQVDDGAIAIPKDYKIGYLRQEISFSKPTILEEGCCGLPDHQKSEEWKVEKVLSGLGFSSNDFQRSPDEFSGGFQVRLNLAKVLVSDPNLLLLDEPTNFLDIISIRWLIKFLNCWQSELFIISHDRNFMDSVCTHILGIYRSKIKKISGSTQKYYDQIAKEEEVYEKERLNCEKKRKQTEVFISRFRAQARHANLVQSRVKSLAKKNILEKMDSIATLSFSFNEAPIPSKYLMEVRDISFSYNGTTPYLIDNVSFTVENHDRICIIGKNGKGKTTLLKLLAGEFELKNGEIQNHPLTQPAYFEQANTAKLNNDLSIEDEILSNHPAMGRKAAMDVCGAMMFSGESASKKIEVLSGGEKCRVLLGKLLIKPSNLLLLDEPTHHFDMESCDSLIDAVNSFNGAAIIVTHNEHFIEKVANKLIVFHKGKTFYFQGGYLDFIEEIGWDDEEEAFTGEELKQQVARQKESASRKDNKKSRAEFFTRRSKTLKPFKDKIEDIEKTINELELKHNDDTQLLIEASQDQNVENITRLSKSLKEMRTNIDNLYNVLEETSEQYDKTLLEFEEEEKTI